MHLKKWWRRINLGRSLYSETETGIKKAEFNLKKTKQNIGTKNSQNYKTVLFVPPTPGSGLLKELRNREEELNKNIPERIKIIEKGGVKILKMLTNKNPLKMKNVKIIGVPFAGVNMEN